MAGLFNSAREWLTPVLTQSAFLDKGFLTPEEFVRAGDHLVACCPSWEWASGDPTKTRPYLPRDKQFLITRGVPSYHRVASLFAATVVGDTIDDETGDGWEAPTLRSKEDIAKDEEAVLVDSEDFDESKSASDVKKAAAVTGSSSSPGEEEYADMEDESLALDEATVTSTRKAPGESVAQGSGSQGNVMQARRYDLSITYDNYYRTPRSWLFGYDENGSPLSSEAVFQDFMQDYVKKTVTIEPHPHLSRPHASVHPCRHAEAMKRILDDLSECGKTPNVDMYMFFFLKFIQGIVPTIEYDYTMDVDVRAADH